MRRGWGSLLAGPDERAGPARLPLPLALATLAAMLVSSLPFWTGPWLGMIDYPNHLARYFVLTRFEDFPDLAKYYRIAWGPLPNIGNDAAIVAVHALTGWPPERISQVLVALAAIGIIPAALLLHRALFGRWHVWPLAAGVFVFNYVLLYGFVNYVAGVTLAILLGAAWILLREAPLALRLPGFAVGALALFFAHLYALGLYGVIVLSHELVRLWQARGRRLAEAGRQALAALHLLPPVLLFLAASPTSGNLAGGRIRWATLGDKAMGLYSVLSIGVHEVTAVSFLAVGAVLGFGLLTRRLVFAPAALVMLALLALAFLAMPFTLLGSGYADYRLPIVLAVVLVAGSAWRGLGVRSAMLVAAVLLAVGLLRTVTMTREWARGNERYAAILELLSAMEPGGKLVAVMAREDARGSFSRRPPLDHAASLAVIARQAFVPSFFAEAEKQPVVFAPEVAMLGRNPPAWTFRLGAAEDRAALASALAPYDHLLLFATDPPAAALPAGARRIDDGRVRGVAVFDLRAAR